MPAETNATANGKGMQRSMKLIHAAGWVTILLLSSGGLAGCGSAQRSGAEPDPLSFDLQRRSATLEDCPEHLAPCASITLEFFTLAGAPEPVRVAVAAFLDSTVFAPVDEGDPGSGEAAPDTLMRRFLDGYADFVRRFPDAPGTWSIRRTARPVWNERGLFSVEFTEESYTGGAHPNAATRLITFDARDGHRVRLDELVAGSDEAPLRDVGERVFRSVHGLGPGEDLVSAGFWFEDGGFQLNDNYAVTPSGLRFHYDAYEIAPYGMGPTDLMLTRRDLAGIARPGGPLDGP
jgi:hypothetical protein